MTMSDYIIEPVAGRKRHDAVRFLIGGARRDEFLEAQAHSLERQTLGDPSRTQLWWAMRGRQCVAAAMVFENPGHTGLLFASPARAPEVDAAALADLVRRIGDFSLGRGLSLVQSLLPPEAQMERDVLLQAGYAHLARLDYMSWDLRRMSDRPSPAEMEMRTAQECPTGTLEAVILSSYKQSLDCPALEGVRQIGNVVAGHRSSGLYRWQSWWIAHWSGQPAACLLLNDNPSTGAADVVYLGVGVEFRGRGIARAMLAHAGCDAWRRGIERLALAVDASNTPAVGLYKSVGFGVIYSREAYILARAWDDCAQPVNERFFCRPRHGGSCIWAM